MALLAGALLGYTISFDEILVTFFLAGVDITLPVYVWNQLRFGFTPEINAVFTLIGTVSIVAIVGGVALLTSTLRDEGSPLDAAAPKHDPHDRK